MSDLTALVARSTGSVTNRSRYRVPVLVGQSDIQQGCRWIVPVTVGKQFPVNMDFIGEIASTSFTPGV